MLSKIRSFLFWPMLILSTLLILVPLAMNRITFRSIKATSMINKFWGVSILWASGVKLKVFGEVPNRGRPFIVVVNHASMLDIAAALTALKGLDFRFASRPLFFKLPILGWDMYLGDHFKLDRDNPRETLRKLFEVDHLKRGISLLLFPEGTRTKTGKVNEFQGGAALAAIHHGVPILPVRIDGLYEVFPKGRYQPKPSTVFVRIGEPISTEGMTRKDAKRLSEEAREWIIHAL